MLRFDIITIFPGFFPEAIDCGILRRARTAGLVDVKAHDLRQWTTDKHHVVVLCGRYEGVDERVAEALVTDEISIGDYVLSGGEPAALVVIDTVVRLIPGA